MQITLESDYAVRITGCLAEAGERLDGGKISESTGVPIKFTQKILRKLVSSGIVRSYQGVRGGYELARAPSEITLKNVIDSIDGECRLSRCLNTAGEFVCTHNESPECTYRRIFNEISALVNEKLESHNFGEMLGIDDTGRE